MWIKSQQGTLYDAQGAVIGVQHIEGKKDHRIFLLRAAAPKAPEMLTGDVSKERAQAIMAHIERDIMDGVRLCDLTNA